LKEEIEMKPLHLVPAVALAFVACGGGEPAESGGGGASGSSQPAAAPPAGAAPAASGAMTVPAWMSVDNTARTVGMTITAGSTPDNNYWNMNGAINGRMTITVPEGYTVSIEFVNRDPNMAHSLGVSPETTNFMTPPAPNPVFPGAITENPGSMTDGTMPGETETIEFVAARAGNYSLVCYIPGHTAVGMWLYFNVSSDGAVGIQTS
jgi:sulfocyanin